MNTFSFLNMLNDRAFAFGTKKFHNKVQNPKFNMQSAINDACKFNIPKLINIAATNSRKNTIIQR